MSRVVDSVLHVISLSPGVMALVVLTIKALAMIEISVS